MQFAAAMKRSYGIVNRLIDAELFQDKRLFAPRESRR
jgi:hypothetical protein